MSQHEEEKLREDSSTQAPGESDPEGLSDEDLEKVAGGAIPTNVNSQMTD